MIHERIYEPFPSPWKVALQDTHYLFSHCHFVIEIALDLQAS
jgi:hypothetical protein